jgi:hypothetical protein
MSDSSGAFKPLPDQRRVLRALAGGAAIAGGTVIARAGQAAEDAVLQSLIRQQQRDAEFGRSSSRWPGGRT